MKVLLGPSLGQASLYRGMGEAQHALSRPSSNDPGVAHAAVGDLAESA